MTTRREFILGIGAFPFFWRSTSIRIAEVRFRVLRHGKSARRYLHIHGNEATAREVLRNHLKIAKGTAHLVANEQRNVPLLGGQLDPNRMFSREGAGKNLHLLNASWSEDQIQKALALLDRDRARFVHAIAPPPGGLLICLHNNGPGYSVLDEAPISDRTSLRNEEHPREFMLCTDPRDYDLLSRSPFNVALQEKAPPDDDGSLSRFAAKTPFRYMNIEAPHGNAAAQRAMLEWAERNLD